MPPPTPSKTQLNQASLDVSVDSPNKADISMDKVELLPKDEKSSSEVVKPENLPQKPPLPSEKNLIPVQVKPAEPDEEAAKLDKILDKVEKKKEEDKAVIKKNLALIKKKDQTKVDEKLVQPLAPTSVPSLYDNSALF